jgi:hypothetical protein
MGIKAGQYYNYHANPNANADDVTEQAGLGTGNDNQTRYWVQDICD